jgi:predicted RNase H-like HicB family nuclease
LHSQLETAIKQLYAIQRCLSKAREVALGWVEEIPGVNTQGATLEEVRENLKDALALVLEMNRHLTEKERPRGRAIRESIRV